MLTVKNFKKAVGVHITTNHNDKMEGLSSLSTAPTCNKRCAIYSKIEGSICSHCYSNIMMKRFKNLRELLENNTEILTSRILKEEELPRLYSETGYFRFEAFGDLVNEIQVVNYFNIAKANPHMKCAIWTKNPFIIKEALKLYDIEKPSNLRIIGSSLMLNNSYSSYFEKFDFIDNCFTVYDKEGAQAVEITCGARSCATCGKCYEGTHDRFEITELLK